jgi:hypothetical protein
MKNSTGFVAGGVLLTEHSVLTPTQESYPKHAEYQQ